MEAGRLRHRITLQERVVTRDGEGGEEISWLDWAVAVPAEIAPINGTEREAAGAMIAEATTRIVIRWRPGIAPTMRVLHDGRIYNISSPPLQDAESGRDFIKLYCGTGANDGQ